MQNSCMESSSCIWLACVSVYFAVHNDCAIFSCVCCVHDPSLAIEGLNAGLCKMVFTHVRASNLYVYDNNMPPALISIYPRVVLQYAF
jgi:hypothetical protein